ncbi:mucin-associated surface protein [Trypanosoma cruzi cruzi]|nr:mucin-associated surface protein [Trypanosoma cruzi cruzi]
MAMMMTGRVLLVCALCVLWCGLCGVAADDVYVPPGDIGTSGKNGVGVGVQLPVLSESPGANEDPTDKDAEESEVGSLESDDLDGQSLLTGAAPSRRYDAVADVSKDGLPRQEEVTIVTPDQPEPVPRVELPSEAKATRPLALNSQEQLPNTPTEDEPLSTGLGGNRPSGELAETASLSPPKGGGAASVQTAGGTTDKSPHNDPLPGAAVTVQNHREGKMELSEKEAKSTKATASTTDSGSTQNSSVNPAAGPLVLQEEAATRDASPTLKPASPAAGTEVPLVFLLQLKLRTALVLTLRLALLAPVARRIPLLLRPRKRRIPLPLVILKALHILPLLLLLHPNPHQIRSPQKAATTPPMNLQWSCRKRLRLRH